MAEKLDSQQWSTFWEKGTPTTFLGRYQNNYDGNIADFWNTFFGRLPNNVQILDLATGNGALALLAANFAAKQGRHFDITGLDYAEIDPAGKVLPSQTEAVRAMISFCPHRTMEQTKLASASFDATISQFGFEYADRELAIAEVSRVLKPNGRFAALMHVEGSILHQQAISGLKEVEYCLSSKLHESVEKLLRRLTELTNKGKDPVNDKKAAQLRQAVNNHTGALHDAMAEFNDPSHLSFFLTNTMALFRAQLSHYTFKEKLAHLAFVREETAAFRLRMKDLLSAVQSEPDIQRMIEAFMAEGFVVDTSEPMNLPEGRFCHQLVVSRST